MPPVLPGKTNKVIPHYYYHYTSFAVSSDKKSLLALPGKTNKLVAYYCSHYTIRPIKNKIFYENLICLRLPPALAGKNQS